MRATAGDMFILGASGQDVEVTESADCSLKSTDAAALRVAVRSSRTTVDQEGEIELTVSARTDALFVCTAGGGASEVPVVTTASVRTRRGNAVRIGKAAVQGVSVLEVGGTVSTAHSGGNAIEMSGGASRRLVLYPGASNTGDVAASA